MSRETTQRQARPVRGALVAIAATGLLAATFVGWNIVGTDGPSRSDPVPVEQIRTETNQPDPFEPALGNGFEWIVSEPTIDLGNLAEIHASSRLQYDECQQGYAEIATEPSSGTHPLYFC